MMLSGWTWPTGETRAARQPPSSPAACVFPPCRSTSGRGYRVIDRSLPRGLKRPRFFVLTSDRDGDGQKPRVQWPTGGFKLAVPETNGCLHGDHAHLQSMGVLLQRRCSVFLCQCPPSVMVASLFISKSLLPLAWFILSFASLERCPSAPRPLLIDLMADRLLCEKWYGLLHGREKKNRNWILASHLSSFLILMSIMFMDYQAVFGSLAQLSLSDRPLGAAGPLMPFWLMGFIF